MNHHQILRASLLRPGAMLLVSTAASGLAWAQCPTGQTLYIRGPHDTKGTALIPGPTYPSNWSFKAITERFDFFYGGCRVFPSPLPTGGGRTSCIVNNIANVQYVESGPTTARHQHTTPQPEVPPFVSDFYIYQVCCYADPASTLFTDVEELESASSLWQFSIPKDYNGPPSCGACPPLGYAEAVRGTLVIDMRPSYPTDNKWEYPEDFGVDYYSASAPLLPTPTYNNFQIGGVGKGLVWIIQDECESRSLFIYPNPLPEDPGTGAETTPCIQLAPAFGSVGGDPASQFCPNYYMTPPKAYPTVALKPYVNQNSPGAASEVVIESSWMELLLGFIDRDAHSGFEVAGQFYTGLMGPGPGQNDRVDVELIIKNESNWTDVPPECISTQPQAYPRYATPEVDFVIQQRVPGLNTLCGAGGFNWVNVPPASIVGSNYIYKVSFEGDQGIAATGFFTNCLGLRVVARTESPPVTESPEIVHLEILSATYVPDTGTPWTVAPGWSSAFRLLILDDRNEP